MEEIELYLDTAEEMMDKAVDFCRHGLAKIRAGKAMPSMLDVTGSRLFQVAWLPRQATRFAATPPARVRVLHSSRTSADNSASM